MRLYKPIELNFTDKPLILTSQLLLDFDFLNQVIVRDLNQTNAFERKLASTMLNLMVMGKRFVVADFQSNEPKLRFKYEVYYEFQAQHSIFLQGSNTI